MALRVIRRVTEEGAYSTLALAGELERSHLAGRDRALAADLAYGTIRRLLALDAALGGVSSRPLTSLDPDVRAILRLGAYQLLWTRVANHAAVSETVSLSTPRARGFVNAVLRRLSSEPPPTPSGSDPQSVEGRTGLAAWAVQELGKVLPTAEVEAAAAALASQAPLTLRVNRCRASPEAVVELLAGRGYRPDPGRHHPDAIVVGEGWPGRLPGHEEGWVAVQDEASMLVASALEPGPGHRILDACAGPGGKAAHLACVVSPGGTVVACDVHHARARLVQGAARRLGVRVHVVTADVRSLPLREGFDAVLVDAPCSGIGSARRRPELLWRPNPGDLSRLARLQVSILTAAADALRPGGRLVYSVCTFPRAETDAVLRAFRAKRPAFEPVDIPGPDGRAPVHRLWPHRHGTDAMFFAGFRRTAAD